MTEAAVATQPQTQNELALVYQYTIEAYKTFQKLAELLPNPLSAQLFKSMAVAERNHRDLLDLKYLDEKTPRMKITLGADLRFQDILEGDLSYRETAEMLIVRERTMGSRLTDLARRSPESERNLYIYIAATKRAHAALIERELELIKLYEDWFRREDAEHVIVHGTTLD